MESCNKIATNEKFYSYDVETRTNIIPYNTHVEKLFRGGIKDRYEGSANNIPSHSPTTQAVDRTHPIHI